MSRARKGVGVDVTRSLARIGVDVTSKERGSDGYHSKEGGRGGCHQQGRG